MAFSTRAARAWAAARSRRGEDTVGAGGGGRTRPGREPGGRAGERRQRGGFGKRQLARALAEIAARRAVHAVSAGAEIDAVQVELQDLLFGERFLQALRVHQLLQLAGVGALGTEEHDFGSLLGDGGTAQQTAKIVFL